MFQQMLNASRAVLLRPSVSTFEEHERNDLGWATIYIAISAVLAAILGAIAFAINRPYIEQQMRSLEDQLQGRPLPPIATNLMGGQSLTASIVAGLLGTLVSFFIWVGLVYVLGRAFGGTGAFGEVAYDISLFWAPIAVIRALVGVVAFGPLAFIGSIIGFVIFLYNFYLSWLSIQSGMNLPGNKALWVILIPILVLVLLCCGLAVLFGALIAGSSTSP